MLKERKVLGHFLRSARLRQGLTQWDVARALKYSTPQFISNWERGVSLLPVDAVPVVCKTLKIDRRAIADRVFRLRTAEAREERELILSAKDSSTPAGQQQERYRQQ